MARRLPSSPPVLAGFSFVHALGSGGFADVFLYEQSMPKRQVAVKVLLSEVVNEHMRQMFQAEANLMAQLSAHPSILTIYEAGISADGRPYLVMELCSSSLAQRYRQARLPLEDVLRVAVQIGSAIETAHRAGVLHRDIKPSNILLTAYGHPVLTDFGIAASLSDSADLEAVGMSIPWSAPEVVTGATAGTVSSEVWAFAATTYSLLAGRSPFELPGGSNTSGDLVTRIRRACPLPTGREDVPAALEEVLARAMAGKPEQRHTSVLELVRTLQLAQKQLGFAETAEEVARDRWALPAASDLDDRTVIRQRAPSASTVSERRQRRRGIGTEGDAATNSVVREDIAGVSVASAVAPGSRRGTRLLGWLVVIASVLVIALGGIALVVFFRASPPDIPAVSDIQATVVQNTVDFTWADPGLGNSDRYSILVGGSAPAVQQREASFSVDSEPGEQVCITVTVTRDGKLGSSSAVTCADLPR
jgi:tRNA A-37 threonylcarbamoyl transferase component Bud32